MRDEVVDLLAALVALPTESRSSNAALIDLVAERASDVGAAVRRVDGPAGRANLHLRFGPEATGGVLLSGHTDVVPAGSGWATDPYTLTVNGDRLLGRGTADMKGFIACALVVATHEASSHWTAPLHLCLSYDEEIGCVGVASLLAQLAADPFVAPEIVVVGEPTGLTLRTSHAGKAAYTVRASCVSGHSSLAATRTNALNEMVAVARTVIDVNTKAAHLGVSTNVGTLQAGTAVNVLASSGEIAFECRHRHGTNPDEVLGDVWAQVEASRDALSMLEGDVEVVCDARYPALQSSEDDPRVQFFADVIGRDCAGSLQFGCEAGLYADALSVPAVVFGPGDIDDAHRPNEFVAADQLVDAHSALTRIVDAYCVARDDPSAKRQTHAPRARMTSLTTT